MTVSLVLTEYLWDGSAYSVSGNTLTFDPGPKSVSKSLEVQWRIMHRGRRKLKKAKFRVRETMTWTISGSCSGGGKSGAGSGLREKIEYYAKRNSKFEILIDASTPQIFLTPNPDVDFDDWAWEDIFVIIKNVKFTLTEGKIGWFDYSIELERVNCELVTRSPPYTDGFTCTPCHIS